MEEVGLKTRCLNQLRRVGMLPAVERALVRLSHDTQAGRVVQKFAPNNYQYPHGTMRECERGGIKYSLDISDYMQYCIYYGVAIEPRDALYGLVKDGTTIIDVGTNIGETLLNFARINRNGINIGFEPVPTVFRKAKHNLNLNNFENIALENLGLSNIEETLSFREPDEHNSGGIYLVKTKGEDVESVRVVRLDDYVCKNGITNISLIKIDVEGFEMNVLNGSIETLKRFMPALFVEVNDGFLNRQGSSAHELFGYLDGLGYTLRYAETGVELNRRADFSGKHFDVVCIAQFN
jgi:FkbM family methyltransferase